MTDTRSSPAAIELRELSKQYSGSSIFAVNKLNLSVNHGEVFGFLGPNGAGKTTTIRMLLNLIQPSSGSGSILGKDIIKDSVSIRRSVGYLSGDFTAYSKMTGQQFLEYLGGLLPPTNKSRIRSLAKTFNANLSKPIGTLSKGNRQKIGIIQAFMHDPRVLILDEPTNGLDPLMQDAFYQLVHESRKKGATIFVSSHNLSEVQKICDRVAIIKDGTLVSEYTIAELTAEAAQTFDITFARKPPLSQLKQIDGVRIIEHRDQKVTLKFSGDFSKLFALLAKNTVTKFDTRDLNLEETFMQFYHTEDKR